MNVCRRAEYLLTLYSKLYNRKKTNRLEVREEFQIAAHFLSSRQLTWLVGSFPNSSQVQQFVHLHSPE